MAESLIKKRKITIAGLQDQISLNELKEALSKEEGVITVDVDGRKGFLRIEYDLKQITFEVIEKSIKELGFKLSQKLTEKFKRGMAKFTEQNERDNLSAAPSSCCEDPKEICHKANR